MSDQNAPDGFLKSGVRVLLVGLTTGALWILSEAWLTSMRYEDVSFRQVVRAASLPYLAFLGALAVIVLVVVRFGLSVIRGARKSDTMRLALSLYFPLTAYIFAGFYINENYLPSLLSLESLLWNAGLLLVTFVTATLLAVGPLSRSRWAAIQRLHGMRPLSIVTLVCLLILCTVSLIPEGRHGDAPVSSTSSEQADAGDSTRPNVIFLLIDALRADHLGCYGYERPTSPRIDEIAQEGCIFERAFAQAPWTRPSVASIFTGLYPNHHHANLKSQRIPEQLTTIAECMKGAGYRTGACSTNANVSPLFGFGQGFDDFHNTETSTFKELTLLGRLLYYKILGLASPKLREWGILSEHAFAEADTPEDERLDTWTRSWLKQNKEDPFFLYLHYFSPHAPYYAPEDFRDRFVSDPSIEIYDLPSLWHYPGSPGTPVSPEKRDALVAYYDAEILYVDSLVGSLADFLKQQGLWDNLLLIITADHGDEFYEHQAWGHGHSLYDELIHVPLITKIPGSQPTVNRNGEMVRLIDLYPSILRYTGIPQPDQHVDGVAIPLSGIGATDDWPVTEAYSEVLESAFEIRSVRTKTRKWIESRVFGEGKEPWLDVFDLVNDPGEAHPLGDLDASLIESLEQQLSSYSDPAGSDGVESEQVEMDPGTRKRLEALGYL